MLIRHIMGHLLLPKMPLGRRSIAHFKIEIIMSLRENSNNMSNLQSVYNEVSDLHVLDSMPLEVCRLSHANRSKIGPKADVQSPLENGSLVSDEGYLSPQ